jgi:nicotinamidase-related amidase
MDESQRRTLEDYQRKGFADRSGYGRKPAFLIVDFSCGFTDPASPLGGDYARELAATARVLDEFRRVDLPVFFTTVAYESHFRDAGVFIKKVPSLRVLVKGSRMVEIDERIRPREDEMVIEKKFASAFFGTDLHLRLQALDVDTVIIAGATTSGCVRASAVDSMQYGFRTIVLRDAVGDRAAGPHEANLFDIDAKYGDVLYSGEVIDWLRNQRRAEGLAGQAAEDFDRWWRRGGSAA